MKLAWAGLLLFSACLFAGTQDSEINVNTRYTVENVRIAGEGWTTDLASDRDDDRISASLRKQIAALIGDKLNPARLDEIASKLKKEFQARAVTHRLLRGASPQYVDVLFEVKVRPTRFDVSVPQFLYSSAEGWSGTLEATATVAQHHAFTFGVLSDGDSMVERASGIEARAVNGFAGDRVRLGFKFASYRELWDEETASALAAPPAAAENFNLYRSRQVAEPVVTVTLVGPLTLSLGASFQSLQQNAPANPTEAANAATAELRYHRRLDDSEFQQDFDVDYNLRAGTRVLASDFAYVRHQWTLRYVFNRGRHRLSDYMTAGMLVGHAPLFERYVLGNSTTLRGWNKYQIDPLGGNRVVHNSVDYRYRWFQAFYDAGAVWDSGQPVVIRQSVGAGVRQGPVFVAIAFPMRSGRLDPIFMVGMNY